MTSERPATTLPLLPSLRRSSLVPPSGPYPLPMKFGAAVSTSSHEWFRRTVGPTDRVSGSLGREPKIADAL